MSDIRILTAKEALDAIPALCLLLADCVGGGASLGFMQPFSPEDAEPFWTQVAEGVAAGTTLLAVGLHDGRIVGSVQVGLAMMPNQPHRGDLKKLLVHRDARGRGMARRLMQAIETEAARKGRTLLVLDTATGSEAEAIYPRLGWERVGVIPDYALWPQGGFCDTTVFYKRIAAA